MSELHQMGLRAQRDALADGSVSARELSEHYLRRIEAAGALNAFITVTGEQALAAADASDARRAAGEARPLDGLPIAHKDLFCTAGVRTSCASRMLDNFISPYDATVVERLDAAGVVSLGKTNMDEFAMGSSNENSWYGPARNPWDTERVPGGSSGGSAVAVAARLVPAATATDTGGSIRQPAAFCGVTGIKPTYGRVSRYGMVAFASSLDQGGVIAGDAADCALLLQHMAGHDPRDSTSAVRELEDFSATLDVPIEGLKIGLPKEYFGEGLSPAVKEAVRAAADALAAQGAELVEVSLPNMALSLPAYYIIAPAEASSNLSRFDGVRYGHRCEDPADLEDLYKRSRAEGLGPEVQRRILVGTYALSAGYYDAYYKRAQRLRRLISEDFARAFEQCDLLLGPVTPGTAWRLGEKGDDPVSMYLEDIYTLSANLAGLPGLALPVGFAEGLPVGMQLLGPHFSEQRLLQVGHQYQLSSDWHRQTPPMVAGEGAA